MDKHGRTNGVRKLIANQVAETFTTMLRCVLVNQIRGTKFNYIRNLAFCFSKKQINEGVVVDYKSKINPVMHNKTVTQFTNEIHLDKAPFNSL